MREILFRGKRIDNGEWIYWDGLGRLTDINGEPIKVEINTSALRPYAFYVNELPLIRGETVGQYTGLKDKNGKRIFEGDIVKLTDKSFGNKWKAVVEFGNPNGNYTWGWQLKPIGKAKNVNTDILCWVEMEEAGAYCEVIGTIHDNPELLEMKK